MRRNPMAPARENSYANAQRQFDIAADMLNLEGGLRKILRVPQRELTVTFPMHSSHTVPAVVTGKPINIGGSQGRQESTARGLVYVLREASRHLSFDITGAKVAIQGFGNVGAVSARVLDEMGATIVAVSDSRGGIYSRNGLSINDVLAHKARTGSVIDFPEADHVTNQELLELPCDILIPAALESQITEQNAGRIKA